MDDAAIFNVIEKYDDPVGDWYKCIICESEIFRPEFNLQWKQTDVYKYCPYCGSEIVKIIDL